MSGDPLAQYRKKPVTAPGETPPPKVPDDYVAFDAKDQVDRLKIRRAGDVTHSPGYMHLLDVVYDGEFGTIKIFESGERERIEQQLVLF